MSHDKPYKLSKILIAVFVLILVFGSVHSALAQFGGSSRDERAAIATVLYFLLGVMISVLTGLASIIDIGLGIDILGNNSTPVIRDAFYLTRNMANMLFIAGLIVTAFATIFSISSYDFRRLLVRIIVIAIIINFSFVICDIIIDWSQSLANIFITAMGSAGNFLGGELNPEILLGAPDSKGTLGLITSKIREWNTKWNPSAIGGSIINAATFYVDGITWTEIIQMVFSLIMGSIIAFGFLIAAFMIIIRVPVLWGLVVIAPLAWALSILPVTKKAYHWWWTQFIGWNLFLPIYLFVFYIGLFLLTKQGDIVGDLTPNNSNMDTFASLGFSFQRIFFYCLTTLALVKGAQMAMNASMFAGAGAIAGAAWAKGTGWAGWVGRLPYRGVKTGAGYAWEQSGAAGAYKEAKERFRKEGLAGFERFEGTALGRISRGERGKEERTAAIAGALSIPGVAERQLGRNVDAETKRFKERGIHLNRGELERLMDTGTPEQRISAAQIYAEENYGALTPERMTSLRNAFGRNLNTSLAASVFRKQKWGEMSSSDLRQLLDPNDPNYIQDPNIRSLIYNALVEKAPNPAEITEALRNGRPGQRGSLVKKARDSIAKSFNEDQRRALLASLETETDRATGQVRDTRRENTDAIREILTIRATEGDSFFNNAAGDPDEALLATYARFFENVGDRKKFLEDTAKKHAYSAAMVMLDDNEIRLRDATGGEITREIRDANGNVVTPLSHAGLTDGMENVELEAMRAVARKLSIDERWSQHRRQTPNRVLQRAFGEEMSRSLESHVRNDKYPTAQTNFIEAQRFARQTIFQQKYLQPFNDWAVKLNAELRGLAASPPKAQALNETKKDLRNRMLQKLVNLRDGYEDTCTKNNLVSDPVDRASVQASLDQADNIIKRFSDRIANLTGTP